MIDNIPNIQKAISINEVYINDFLITNIEMGKNSRQSPRFVLKSQDKFISHKEITSSKIICNGCKKFSEIKWASILYHLRRGKIYLCASCSTLGIKNPFYNRKHSEESKRKSVETYGDRTGANNPFYGKTFSPEAKQKIKENRPSMKGMRNPFYGKTHNLETRKKYLLNLKREVKILSIFKNSEKMQSNRLKIINSKLLNQKKKLRDG